MIHMILIQCVWLCDVRISVRGRHKGGQEGATAPLTCGFFFIINIVRK